MIAADAARQIKGAFRLGQRDPAGLADLDVSIDGFWRSFGAAVLVLPAYAVLVLTEPAPTGVVIRPPVDPLVQVLVDGIAYVVYWTIMPVLMIHITRLLQREKAYTAYVVADNWAQVPQTYLMALVSLIGESALLPQSVQALLAFAAMIWVLLFKFSVARLTLGIGRLPAAGVVLVDLIAGLFIDGITERLGG